MTVAPNLTRVPDHPVDPQFLSRWSPRAFSDEAMDETELLTLLEAARWAPSAVNAQPWRFAWGLRGEPAFQAIAAALNEGNRTWAPRASALVVVGSRSLRRSADGAEVANTTHAFDAGTAWGHLALQAHLRGWAAHAMGGFDRAALTAAVGAGPAHVLHAVVAIGRQAPADTLPEALRQREIPSQRQPLANLAARGQLPD